MLTWGRGTSGQLGHGEMVNILEPKRVTSLEGIVVARVSAGWSHSGFVSGPLRNTFSFSHFETPQIFDPKI